MIDTRNPHPPCGWERDGKGALTEGNEVNEGLGVPFRTSRWRQWARSAITFVFQAERLWGAPRDASACRSSHRSLGPLVLCSSPALHPRSRTARHLQTGKASHELPNSVPQMSDFTQLLDRAPPGDQRRRPGAASPGLSGASPSRGGQNRTEAPGRRCRHRARARSLVALDRLRGAAMERSNDISLPLQPNRCAASW